MGIGKTAGKAALWAAAALVSIIGLLLIINAFDEEPDPGIAEFSAIRLPAVKDADNAYYAMIMIHAPVNEDAHAKGVAWVLAMNKAIDAGDHVEEARLASVMNSRSLAFDGDRALITVKSAKPGEKPLETGLGRLMSLKEKLPGLISRNKALFDRYIGLYKYPGFLATLRPTRNSPIVFLNDEQGLVHANIALLISNGRKADALRLLRDDAAFWRRALAGSGDYVERPAIIFAIKRDLVLLSEIFREQNLSRAELAIAEEIVRPLTEAELDEGPAIRSYFGVGRYLMTSFAKGDQPGKEYYLLRLLYCPNATINRMYRYQSIVLEFARLSPGGQAAAIRDRRIPKIFGESDSPPAYTMLYNPVGKTILGIGAPDLAFVRYGHNLGGLMRLVTLQFLMKRARVKAADVEKYIVHSGRSYFDPFAEAEMKWDEKDGMIYFYGMDKNGELKEKIGVRI